MTSIHLNSDFGGELAANSDRRFLYLLMGIAGIILLLAAANYLNLSSSLYTRRFQEAGVRKVLGAGRRQLSAQFLVENMLTALIAFSLAVLLAELCLPFAETLADKRLKPAGWQHLLLLASVLGAALLAGLLSGLYPILFLTRQRIPGLLKRFRANPRRRPVWKWMVVGQFCLAVLLITNTVMLQ